MRCFFGRRRLFVKKKICLWMILLLLCSSLFETPIYAVGDGNLNHGGGGMGQGTSQNKWSPGMEGVRVTIVKAEDGTPVTTSIDLTNKKPTNIQVHFGAISKISYNRGSVLKPSSSRYRFVNPAQALPKIIRSDRLGVSSIEEMKRYFTDEQVLRSIARLTGMDFDTMVSGRYKVLVEPLGYYIFQGVFIATTATEAALYDEQLGGKLRSKMVSFSHQNLPLSIFLETPDLGYPAWHGSRTSPVSNFVIQSTLGIGIVRFRDVITPPEISTYDYQYRTNTEVITSVEVSGGQSDPDHPVSVTFQVNGRIYTVNNVYYPKGDSQLAWIRWKTPKKAQTMTILVQVHGNGSVSKGRIQVKIVDLDENPPPDPNADDRKDDFICPALPQKAQVTSASWGVWRPWWQAYWVWHNDGEGGGYWCDHGWWEFAFERYIATLSASMSMVPDQKVPTASGKTMKSGYGIHEIINTHVSTTQHSAVTPAQNAVAYFPEFEYRRFWRLLDRMSSGYDMRHELKRNRYSTYNRRTHFTPIWYPDGKYTGYTWLLDCWTPAGMLSMNLNDSIRIDGNLWSDWHIAPKNRNQY